MIQCSDFAVGQEESLGLSYHNPKGRGFVNETIYVKILEVHCLSKTDFLEKIVVEQILGYYFYLRNEDDKWTKVTRTIYAEELMGALRGRL